MAVCVAITGGIGSGKSIVSKILRAEGYCVYDCDAEAKRLMDTDMSIKRRLCEEIHPDCVKGGLIDRKLISKVVFSNSSKLERLNNIVHGGVRQHLASWIRQRVDNQIVFVETAILYESGVDKMVDVVWEVKAPIQLRISRVIERNGFSHRQVLERIKSQDAFIPGEIHPDVTEIINDDKCAVLPQIKRLITAISPQYFLD